MMKTPAMLELEAKDPKKRDIRTILRDAYARTGSTARAAQVVGISAGAFSTWVNLLGGEIRSEVSFPAADPEPAEEVAA